MTVVLLAAGSSERMGKINKMLIPIEGVPLVVRSASTALSFLDELDEKSRLIIVTGYRHLTLKKVLKPCFDDVCKTQAPVDLILVNNRDYKNGQFSSVLKGISEIIPDDDFFISLADLYKLTKEDYRILVDNLKDKDAVRPEYKGTPGHPVLFASKMKTAILNSQNCRNVKDVLEKSNVVSVKTKSDNCIRDLDCTEDLENL